METLPDGLVSGWRSFERKRIGLTDPLPRRWVSQADVAGSLLEQADLASTRVDARKADVHKGIHSIRRI